MEVVCLKSKFLRNLFDQNTYVVKNGKSAVIIDAGAELDELKKEVEGLKVEAILISHIHFDHIWYIEEYIKEFDCNVYVCKGAEDKFLNPQKNASVMLKTEIVKNIDDCKISYYEDKLEFGDINIDVYFCPGHSEDCVCLKIGKNLFCGDVVFAQGVGRTDIIDSDSEKMIQSLKNIRLIDYEKAYPGHYESTIKEQIDKIIEYYI